MFASIFSLTNYVLGVVYLAILTLHVSAVILVRRAARQKGKPAPFAPLVSGVATSFAGTTVWATHWFPILPYTGPIGYGIGLLLSPVLMFGSVCVFFSLGWATYLLANQAVGTEDTGAAVAHWVRTLALAGIVVVDLAAIGAYIFCTHPRDFGLTARPQDNFVNSLGMGMVKTSDGYWVGKSEVRQAEFQDLMGYNPSFSKDPNKPVEMISADEALTFCEKLTELDRARGTLPKGFVYTLPTETMWRKYVADARIEDAILSRGTIRAAPEDVGTLPPNRLGLHDVRGNVAEYCLDWYDVARKYRVIRGGSYRNRNPEYWSIDNRAGAAGDRSSDIGFRVVLVPTRASPGGNH